MIDKRIENLIVKYCSNHLKAKEAQELNKWLELEGNKTLFQEYIALNFSMEELKQTNRFEKIAVWSLIQEQIHTKKRKVEFWKYAAAAAIVLLLSLPFVLKKESSNGMDAPIIVNNIIAAGTNKAILTLEDGTNKQLEKGQYYISDNLTSNGEEIIYKNAKETQTKIAYNYLTIPRGGQFFVQLSDSTKVWLNSESKLKYPVEFPENQDRVVELVYGEAYFDVSSSSGQKKSKFSVVNQGQTVEVLGTHFNIKAYPDEDFIYTTLVEGKVQVSNDVHILTLVPNQQSVIDIRNKNIEVQQVKVKDEIAWINGDFVFKKLPLIDIIKTLSRWYDVEFILMNKAAENEKFTGELSKYQSIEEILKLIKNTKIIDDYEIKDKTIVIK